MYCNKVSKKSQTKVAFIRVLFYNIHMKCFQCPVRCGTDRDMQNGACGVQGLKIAKYYLHPFEEPPISYKNGSGCIFFCGCSLKCVFCQNFELSRNTRGKTITAEELADIFRQLEDMGAENINLVNPTHYLKDIAAAISVYRPKIPIVYNTHGYENIDDLKEADKFVDIWLTDFKFLDPMLAKRYTSRENYAEIAMPAVEFMARKPLEIQDGKMLSGCIVRHLIIPMAAYDSVNIVKFVSTLPQDVYFSLMSQYTPFGNIENFKELQRSITRREYQKVLNAVEEFGLQNVFLQDSSSAKTDFIPVWDW